MNVVQFRQRLKPEPLREAVALAGTMGLDCSIESGDDFQYLSIDSGGSMGARFSLTMEDDGSWLLGDNGDWDFLQTFSEPSSCSFNSVLEALREVCERLRVAKAG